MEYSTEILYNRTSIYCTPAHRFGTDALLLARFALPRRDQRAADLETWGQYLASAEAVNAACPTCPG